MAKEQVHPLKIDQVDHKSPAHHPTVEMPLIDHPDEAMPHVAKEYGDYTHDTPRAIKTPKG